MSCKRSGIQPGSKWFAMVKIIHFGSLGFSRKRDRARAKGYLTSQGREYRNLLKYPDDLLCIITAAFLNNLFRSRTREWQCLNPLVQLQYANCFSPTLTPKMPSFD